MTAREAMEAIENLMAQNLENPNIYVALEKAHHEATMDYIEEIGRLVGYVPERQKN